MKTELFRVVASCALDRNIPFLKASDFIEIYLTDPCNFTSKGAVKKSIASHFPFAGAYEFGVLKPSDFIFDEEVLIGKCHINAAPEVIRQTVVELPKNYGVKYALLGGKVVIAEPYKIH